jgi:hypothetical protein
MFLIYYVIYRDFFHMLLLVIDYKLVHASGVLSFEGTNDHVNRSPLHFDQFRPCLYSAVPTMSSLRNSLHRRNHKERSQLSHRTRLGFLEKHKDYVLRARDYHSKKDRIQRLRQKAADRNKDEFYFGMNKQKTKVCKSIPQSCSSTYGGAVACREASTSKIEGTQHCPSTL